MVIGTRQRIINAFLRLASKHPYQYRTTLAEVAAEAHVSRQAIYRKHYSSVEEIIEDIHQSLALDIKQSLAMYDPENDTLCTVIVNALLPTLYKNRETLKILSTSYLDPSWSHFINDYMERWIGPYVRVRQNTGGITRKNLHEATLKQIRVFLAIWIAEEVPQAPEAFAKVLMKLMNHSISDYLE